MRPSDRFDSLIQYWAERVELPPALVKAHMLAESSGNPNARSVCGAMGLLQLMPGTAREMGCDDPYDPDQNLRAGAEYLARQKANVLLILGADFPNQSLVHRLALCSYNAGFGYVRAALRAADLPLTWDTFTAAFKQVTFNGKRPDWKQALPYAERIVP